MIRVMCVMLYMLVAVVVVVVVVVMVFLKVLVAVLGAHFERDLILLIRAVLKHQMNVVIVVMAHLTVIITLTFNVVVLVLVVAAVAHVDRFVSVVGTAVPIGDGFRAGAVGQIGQVADDLVVGDRRRNGRVGQRVGARRVGQTLSYRLYHCIERAAQRVRLLAEKTRIDCVWLIGFDRGAFSMGQALLLIVCLDHLHFLQQ